MGTFWTDLEKPILALAPMEGVTDSAFRQMAKRGGADVVYTEFVSADAILHGGPSALAKLAFAETEQPVVCQIFGREPEKLAEAARTIERRGFAGIDLNLGCPARKVVGAGMGVALLRDPQQVRRLVEAVLNVVSLPVSIKVRSSIRRERKEVQPGCADRVTVVDIVEAIRDLPLAAIMVHGRSFEQGFSGGVDTDMIRQVKERFPGVVVANGGVRTPEDAKRLLDATGAGGVGIARGSLGAPWLFGQIRSLLTTGAWQPVAWPQRRQTVLEHAALALTMKGGRGLVELRKHLAWYVRGLPSAAAVRQQLVRVSTIEDIERILPAGR